MIAASGICMHVSPSATPSMQQGARLHLWSSVRGQRGDVSLLSEAIGAVRVPGVDSVCGWEPGRNRKRGERWGEGADLFSSTSPGDQGRL